MILRTWQDLGRCAESPSNCPGFVGPPGDELSPWTFAWSPSTALGWGGLLSVLFSLFFFLVPSRVLPGDLVPRLPERGSPCRFWHGPPTLTTPQNSARGPHGWPCSPRVGPQQREPGWPALLGRTAGPAPDLWPHLLMAFLLLHWQPRVTLLFWTLPSFPTTECWQAWVPWTCPLTVTAELTCWLTAAGFVPPTLSSP